MNFAYFAKLDRSIVLKIIVSLTIKKTRNYYQFITIKDIKSKIKSNELTYCIYIYVLNSAYLQRKIECRKYLPINPIGLTD